MQTISARFGFHFWSLGGQTLTKYNPKVGIEKRKFRGGPGAKGLPGLVARRGVKEEVNITASGSEEKKKRRKEEKKKGRKEEREKEKRKEGRKEERKNRTFEDGGRLSRTLT